MENIREGYNLVKFQEHEYNTLITAKVYPGIIKQFQEHVYLRLRKYQSLYFISN